jgi:hypothetical protein
VNKFTVGDSVHECEPFPRTYSAEEVLAMVGKSADGVRALRQFFVGEGRQRWWPLGWGDRISIEDGDRFEIETGERLPAPTGRN